MERRMAGKTFPKSFYALAATIPLALFGAKQVAQKNSDTVSTAPTPPQTRPAQVEPFSVKCPTKLHLKVNGPLKDGDGKEPYWEVGCGDDKSMRFNIPVSCPANTRFVVIPDSENKNMGNIACLPSLNTPLRQRLPPFPD